MDTSENLWMPRDLTPEQMCFNQPIQTGTEITIYKVSRL